ncbi:MAG: FAD/NAD(P)-binding protein [Actinobacteria bacterium]|nr:FAD/NAD(P)-binding protein [Actinomycetota bacterium]
MIMDIKEKETAGSSIYVPEIATILKIEEMSQTEKLFDIRLDDQKKQEKFCFLPGQFVELTIFGLGEAPFSIPSSPGNRDFFQLCIRDTGNVSGAIHRMKAGDKIGIRGPFGKGYFPYERMKGKDVIIVAGGLGLAPVMSLIKTILEDRDSYKRLVIIYGATDPSNILFRKDIEDWKKRDDIELGLTVDNPDSAWQENVGVCTNLIPGINCTEDAYAVVCGPPVMYKFVVSEFEKKCIKPENIFLSLERRMECGVGKCNHCHVGNKLSCVDGPVFSLWEIRNLKEAI